MKKTAILICYLISTTLICLIVVIFQTLNTDRTIVSCQRRSESEFQKNSEMFRNTSLVDPEIVTIDGEEYIQYNGAEGYHYICPKTKETHDDKDN
jgi:hypothetical protein